MRVVEVVESRLMTDVRELALEESIVVSVECEDGSRGQISFSFASDFELVRHVFVLGGQLPAMRMHDREVAMFFGSPTARIVQVSVSGLPSA